MRRLRLALMLTTLAVGCARSTRIEVDATLPDDPGLPAGTAREILEEAASGGDPTHRGLAIAWMARALPEDEVRRWAMQGTFDPEPFVQTRVTQALLARGGEEAERALVGLAKRGSADPYVRAVVGLARPDLAQSMRDAWRDQPLWKKVALAAPAAALGDAEAEEVVAQALAGGLLRDDDHFYIALGLQDVERWRLAASLGAELAEEQSAVRLAILQGIAGEVTDLKKLLRSDPSVQQEALDLALAAPDGARGAIVKATQGASDPGVRQAAGLVARPTASRLLRAMGADDPYVRWVATRMAGKLDASEARPVIELGLLDASSDVRRAAVEAVADLRLTGVDAMLTALRGDDREDVRIAASGAELLLAR